MATDNIITFRSCLDLNPSPPLPPSSPYPCQMFIGKAHAWPLPNPTSLRWGEAEDTGVQGATLLLFLTWHLPGSWVAEPVLHTVSSSQSREKSEGLRGLCIFLPLGSSTYSSHRSLSDALPGARLSALYRLIICSISVHPHIFWGRNDYPIVQMRKRTL